MNDDTAAKLSPAVPTARRPLAQRRWMAVGCMGLIGFATWWFAPTKVYVVNGFSFPIRVVLDGNTEFVVEPRSDTHVSLMGGSHVAEFAYANDETEAFEFSVHWSPFPSTVHVFNPGAGAVLTTSVVSYGDVPLDAAPESDYYIGDSFRTFSGIDFAFIPAPDSVESASAGSGAVVHKTRLAFTSCPGESADLSADDVLAHCERHLLKEATPAQDTLWMYQTAAERFQAEERRLRFLQELGASADAYEIPVSDE